MKIKIIEIEASADDLRVNRTLSDALRDALDRCFSSVTVSDDTYNEESEEIDGQET